MGLCAFLEQVLSNNSMVSVLEVSYLRAHGSSRLSTMTDRTLSYDSVPYRVNSTEELPYYKSIGRSHVLHVFRIDRYSCPLVQSLAHDTSTVPFLSGQYSYKPTTPICFMLLSCYG